MHRTTKPFFFLLLLWRFDVFDKVTDKRGTRTQVDSFSHERKRYRCVVMSHKYVMKTLHELEP
jgi:hypothetical protein